MYVLEDKNIYSGLKGVNRKIRSVDIGLEKASTRETLRERYITGLGLTSLSQLSRITGIKKTVLSWFMNNHLSREDRDLVYRLLRYFKKEVEEGNIDVDKEAYEFDKKKREKRERFRTPSDVGDTPSTDHKDLDDPNLFEVTVDDAYCEEDIPSHDDYVRMLRSVKAGHIKLEEERQRLLKRKKELDDESRSTLEKLTLLECKLYDSLSTVGGLEALVEEEV